MSAQNNSTRKRTVPDQNPTTSSSDNSSVKKNRRIGLVSDEEEKKVKEEEEKKEEMPGYDVQLFDGSSGPPYSTAYKLRALELLDYYENDVNVTLQKLNMSSRGTLLYWRSNRDKLMLKDKQNQMGSSTSSMTTKKKQHMQEERKQQVVEQKKKLVEEEKKEPRNMMNMGRKPSFLHEKQLLEWLQLQQTEGKDIGTYDILVHLQKTYPYFTEGKEHNTLRKWILRYLVRQKAKHLVSPLGKRKDIPKGSQRYYTNEFKLQALQKLQEIGNVAEVAKLLDIKTPTSISYWKSIEAKLETSSRTRKTVGGSGRNTSFLSEDKLFDWVLQQESGVGVDQVVGYLNEHFPDFLYGKKENTQRTWVTRFLKRCAMHIKKNTRPKSYADNEKSSKEQVAEIPPQESSYTNSFKLEVLTKLDEINDIHTVAEMYGIKHVATLTYWKKIRSKLEQSIGKEKYRIPGGGRKSSFAHEQQLINWCLDKRKSGEIVNMNRCLNYMTENFPEFTEDKKTATLRTWIMRFFKKHELQKFTSLNSNTFEPSKHSDANDLDSIGFKDTASSFFDSDVAVSFDGDVETKTIEEDDGTIITI